MSTKTRVDKWLWSVRIYKTRTLASSMCKNNRVKVNDKLAKASQTIEIGDIVVAEKEGINLSLEVQKLISKRVGASIAVECYKDLTPEEEYKKFDQWYIGKAKPEFREKGAGRPTKKERRAIENFKDQYPL